MIIPSPRNLVLLSRAIKPWQAGQFNYLLHQFQLDGLSASTTDHSKHLLAAAQWLARAQEMAPNGGIPGRYVLATGWTKPYPKTAGDLISTFLNLAQKLDDQSYFMGAKKFVQFLLPLQTAAGAFLAGEIDGSTQPPSAFNTAQIISGLTAWHVATGDQDAFDAATRGADWLVSIQDLDGAWRKHFYNDIASTHSAYLACWLAELGRIENNALYLESARRNLTWVLSYQVRDTGWIDLAGYDLQQQEKREALTHSIAYTLMGALRTARALDDEVAIAAIRKSARFPAQRILEQGFLSAIQDWQWRAKSLYTCLPGNGQLAELWLTLYAIEREQLFFDAANLALDIIKRSQSLVHPNQNIHGGIPGSSPIWGDYLSLTLPNWGAKFFVDALMMLEQQTANKSTNQGSANG